MNKNKKYLLVLVILITLISIVGYLKLIKPNKIIPKAVVQTTLLSNQSSDLFPLLNLPIDYFSTDSAVQKDWEAGYPQIIRDPVEYQSYPTTVTTIKNYSNEIKPLQIKTFDEIMQEQAKLEPSGFGKTLVENNYNKYGALSSNYLPKYDIWTLNKFDVDNDGTPETVVSYNGTWYADAGSYNSDIIKGNNIVFSVTEDNARIVPADTPNGFYVEWHDNNLFQDSRCCQEGFVRTRFVYKDRKFIPVYEQVVRYLKIGK